MSEERLARLESGDSAGRGGCLAGEPPEPRRCGDPTTARDVALIICGHAHTTDDAALLLDMLGLVDGGRLALPVQPLLEVRDIKQVASTGSGGRGYR